jgi:TatD DNase family protein
MIFDTHTHLNDETYTDVKSIVKEAKNAGVERMLCVGFDEESSQKAIQIAEKYPGVFASVGHIPSESGSFDDDSLPTLRTLAKSSNKVKAIGEIGLDYHREKTKDGIEKQKKMFISQIGLANELNLPVSIHARESLDDVLNILKKYPVKQGGIMHCYSGTLEQAFEFVRLGYKIAFGGVLTFKKAEDTRETFRRIPLSSIVFETDAPYLTPMPHRGETNFPKRIVDTVHFAADLIDMNIDKLEKISYENSLYILHVKTNEY